MKPKVLFAALFVFFGLVHVAFSQTDDLVESMKYRRSSLHMVLIESESFPNKDLVMASWNNYPFPDKYDKHEIELKSFDIASMQLTDDDLMKAGFLIDTLKTPMQLLKATSTLKNLKYLNPENTVAIVIPTEKEEYQLKINKIINESKLANKLVSKWFNLKDDGSINFDLIAERGSYNASELDLGFSEGQVRSDATLMDAGLELIANTFVTFTKLDFVPNEPIARAVRDAAKEEAAKQFAGKPAILLNKANDGIDKVYERTKEGYSLWSKTWLYQLDWDANTFAIFQKSFAENGIKAFDDTDLLKLKFIGVQYNQSLVTFSLGQKRTEEQIIDLALVRNIDNAFAKLQKENDVFKPKVPVLSSNPITAQIGMKEGLEGNEKFQVLEMIMNPKTGLTEYKVVGTVTAVKNMVWDNRYNAGEPQEPRVDAKGNPLPEIKSTQFAGGNNVQPGMLLKQTK
jgi:archaellum component FlaF (FlaF/FlaG flagellin family)